MTPEVTTATALGALANLEADLQAEAEVENDPESELDVSEDIGRVVAEMARQVALPVWVVLVPDECGNPWDAGLSVFVSHEAATTWLKQTASESEWTVETANDGLEFAMYDGTVVATVDTMQLG